VTLPRRQRRRKAFRGEPAARRAKPPFPVNLIWNVKFFYVAFIVVMILSLAAVGLAPGVGSTPGGRTGAPVDEDVEAIETPEGLPTFEGPQDTIDTGRAYTATIATDQGDIVVALDTENAPQTANSFAFLAGHNFYDGMEFFWVIPGFDAQTGDPTCVGSEEFPCSGVGGPGYTLAREGEGAQAGQWAVIAPVTVEGGDQVHGSQFVIAMSEDGDFEGTVLGRVTAGQEILQALGERKPCFGTQAPTEGGCQAAEDLPPALKIRDVVVQPA
jgi:cyclophilin family peptidyl-prolyl cis-trans isomerase